MAGAKNLVETDVTDQTLDVELERWMAEVAPCQWRPVKPLQAPLAALLVVDMNKPFVEESGTLSTPGVRAVLPRIIEMVAAFRQDQCFADHRRLVRSCGARS